MERLSALPGEKRLEQASKPPRTESDHPQSLAATYWSDRHAVQRFLFTRRTPPKHFFSYVSEPVYYDKEKRTYEGDATCVREFGKMVDIYGFDDEKLIALLQLAGPLLEHRYPLNLDPAQKYLDSGAERSELSSWHESTEKLMRCIASVLEATKALDNILAGHKLFADRESVAQRGELIIDALKKARVKPGFPTIVHIPPKVQAMIGKKSLDVQTLNPFEAQREMLKAAGLFPALAHILALGVLLRYAYESYQKRRATYGNMPTVLPKGKDGLTFAMRDFAPGIIDKRFFDADGLEEMGLDPQTVQRIKSQLHQYLDYDGRWKYVPSEEHIRSALQRVEEVSDAHIAFIHKSATESSFRPFRHIQIDSRNRIAILTGANGDGKSTMMKAVGENLHRAHTGTTAPSGSLTTTLSDGIFDDFNVKDSLENGVSKFRAQVKKIVEFLTNATPHSLGMFDELYHGTNSAYQLSLAWATIEEFSRRKLRAIISTHEQQLTLAATEAGYAAIAGTRHVPEFNPGTDASGIRGAHNLSVHPGFSLAEGPVMNSDAFLIAEQEGLPGQLLSRAREIYAHVTRQS